MPHFRLVPLLALVPSFALAAPVTLTHAGYVLDAADAPVSRTGVPFAFSIWSDAASTAAGARVWPASADATCTANVSAGYFSVELGGGCGTGLDSASFAAGAPRWLQITMDGLTLTPRLALGTTPTAAIALDADKLGGLARTGFWEKTQDLGTATIGAGTLSAALGARALLAGNNTFTGTNAFTGATSFGSAAQASISAAGAVSAASFTGDGANVTNVNAARLGGKTLAEIGSGGITLGDDTSTCTGTKAGALRYRSGKFEGCDGLGTWKALGVGATSAPQILDVVPQSGAVRGGTTVTISGLNFASGATVTFGLAAGTVTSITATQIVVTAPAGTALGGVSVRVANTDGGANTAFGAFTYVSDGSAQAYALASCKAIRDAGLSRGATIDNYWIDPNGGSTSDAFRVQCDMLNAQGGWTLVAYNWNKNRTFLGGTYHAVTGELVPVNGSEAALDPTTVGLTYTQIGFFTNDPQWVSAGTRDYSGFWVGDAPTSTYNLKSNTCQLLSRTSTSQWNGQLVYFAGDGANDNGCTGGGSVFTTTHTCDDGGGGVTTNNAWPMNSTDALWGYNCISSYNPTGSYKTAPTNQGGQYFYYVR